ncbi:MAG: hypothetical protein IIZ25_09805 [Thermoguttaceae bacterium]|nr:hypothetical protein [Thermoguttaceae bacterium]
MMGHVFFRQGGLFVLLRTLLGIVTTAICCAAGAQQSASTLPVRLNISFSCDCPHQWRGEISLSSGFFWNSVPLNSDRGASATFQRTGEKNGLLRFSSSEPSSFCGVQTTAVLPPDGSISLSVIAGNGRPTQKTIRLSEIINAPVHLTLDGNQLTIQRAPGDTIPLSVSRLGGERFAQKGGAYAQSASPSMVFDPNETLILGLFTRYLRKTGSGQSFHISLLGSQSDIPIWTSTVDISDAPDTRPRLDVEVPLKGILGPFRVKIDLVTPTGKSRYPLLGQKGQTNTVLDSRIIEGVVVEPPAEGSKVERLAELRGRLLETVDPTNPSWWQIFSKNKLLSGPAIHEDGEPETLRGQEPSIPLWTNELPGKEYFDGLRAKIPSVPFDAHWGQWDSFWQHSLGSGHLSTRKIGHDSFAQLGPAANSPLKAWEAYTIPIKEPGKAHLLEIDYPADQPMALGVSILEPSVTGGVFPRTIDGGVHVSASDISDRISGRVLRYQLLFWPKTMTPTILMTAPKEGLPAIYGRIKIYRARDQWEPRPQAGGRDFTAVMSRPLLCDQFSAPRKKGSIGVMGAEDWNSFDAASARLAQYLNVAGYNSLIMSVAADGSALYPSEILRPNPKFDGGIFLPNGEDPVRKDVPELIYRRFNQRGMTFIPMLDLNAPLPELEENAAGDDLFWIGPDGKRLKIAAPDGQVTPYNILHPRVQEALLRAVTELLLRYAHHPSFGGVALELSDTGPMLLPNDPICGLDDTLFASFVSALLANTPVTDELKAALSEAAASRDAERFARRAALLQGDVQIYWLSWRAACVHTLCEKIAATIKSVHPAARLHLVWTAPPRDGFSGAIFASPHQRAARRREAMVRCGYDPKLYTDDDSIILYRPGRVADGSTLRTLESGDAQSRGCVALYPKSGPEGYLQGTYFHHDSEARHLTSFDAASPFRPTFTSLETLLVPSEEENLRRFTHQLAVADTLRFAEGGRMLPLGGEDSLAEWIDVWRELPNRPFQTYCTETGADGGQESLQPVVVRTLSTEQGRWIYLLNDAPYHCGVHLSVSAEAGTPYETFVGGRAAAEAESSGGRISWQLSLRPYDLVAMRITDPDCVIAEVQVNRPDEICSAGGRIQRAIEKAADRLQIAATGTQIEVDNPGFNLAITQERTVAAESDGKKSSRLGLDISYVNILKKNAPQEETSNGDIPGWVILTQDTGGACDGGVLLDHTTVHEGDASLRLKCSSLPVAVMSRPFVPSASGRLFVNLAFGIPEGTKELPLQISLVGSSADRQWTRTLQPGEALLRSIERKRASGQVTAVDGIIWTREVLLFDTLPIEGLEQTSLRFDLTGPGVVWLDDMRLYDTALLRSEQEDLAQCVASAARACGEDRFADAAALLELPAMEILARCVPEEALANAPPRPEYVRFDQQPPEVAAQTDSVGGSPPEEKKNFFKRIIPW